MPGQVDSTLLVLLILAGTDHTNSLVSAAMLKEPAGRYVIGERPVGVY
jgi:hypothetical protein